MSDFLREMQGYADKVKREKAVVTTYTAAEMEHCKRDAEGYIQYLVEQVKNQIRKQAQANHIRYNNIVKNSLFGKQKVYETEPHYRTSIDLIYGLDFSMKCFQWVHIDYTDEWDYNVCGHGYRVSDFRIIEYIIRELIRRLENENIYLIKPDINHAWKDKSYYLENLKVTKGSKNSCPGCKFSLSVAYFLD